MSNMVQAQIMKDQSIPVVLPQLRYDMTSYIVVDLDSVLCDDDIEGQ